MLKILITQIITWLYASDSFSKSIKDAKEKKTNETGDSMYIDQHINIQKNITMAWVEKMTLI